MGDPNRKLYKTHVVSDNGRLKTSQGCSRNLWEWTLPRATQPKRRAGQWFTNEILLLKKLRQEVHELNKPSLGSFAQMKKK